MAPEHPYININGNYYCARCNLLSLVWVILFKKKELRLHVFDIRRRQLPDLLKAISDFRRNRTAYTTDKLNLPLPGHLCIPVHYGYKVFNFSRLTTTKIFSEDATPSNVLSEINCVREASSLPFTPALLEVDADGRWYRESFIPGDRSSRDSQSDPQALFKQSICEYLAGILGSKTWRTVTLTEYLSGIRNTISGHMANFAFDQDLCAHVNMFVKKIAGELERIDNTTLQLAFTHGDFSFVNFIYGSKGITVIDWESAKQRSILHDLYNYFFTELYYERTPSLRRADFTESIERLSQRLASGGMPLTDTITDSEDVYRWLYYLERMQMLIEREMSPDLQNVILRSIEVFDRFEASYC